MFDVFAAIIGNSSAIYVIVAAAVLFPIVAGWMFRSGASSSRLTNSAVPLQPSIPVSYNAPIYSDREKLEKQIFNLRTSSEFAAISRAIADHLRKPRTLTDGSRSYDSVVFVLIRPLFDCADRDGLVAAMNWYRAALATRPDDENLLGLYLRALQVGGWRAAEFAAEFDDDEGWKQSVSWFQEIDTTVNGMGLNPAANPLIAEAWYHAAALRDDAATELSRRFPAMVSADAQNLRFWELRAHHLTPQLWGSVDDINEHMEWAVTETRDAWAESAIINVLRAVMDHIDPLELRGLTDRRLMSAVTDLSCELSAQEDINALLSQMVLRGWQGLPELIMRDYVTEIVHSVWYRENDYLALAARARKCDLELPAEEPEFSDTKVPYLRLVQS